MFFYFLSTMVLKGYSGAVQNGVSILRNLAALCKLNYKVIEWLLVAAGVGICIVPDDCIHQRSDLRFVPIENWHQALYMCILYDKWLEPPIWDFVEMLVKSIRSINRDPLFTD